MSDTTYFIYCERKHQLILAGNKGREFIAEIEQNRKIYIILGKQWNSTSVDIDDSLIVLVW